MEQFFASLSKRQTMLLLTSLAFGGSDASFEHLSIEEEELLKHRAQHLLQIPRDKRIPLVIQEIKRIVTAKRRQLANADPKRLAGLLSKERSALVEVVLRALPSELADACRAEMGPRPTSKLMREVRPDVLSIIRWKLEDGLKQGAPQVGTFRFSDLLMMPQREVLSICDRMGARVLATAVAGLADDEREALLAKLPPDQRSLASKASEAGKSRKLSEADAKMVLEIHGAIEEPSRGLRSAGAQRVIRAALAQSAEFAQRLTERYHGHELGKLLAKWHREEKVKPVKGDGGRLDIVEQMERLAQKGVIDRPLRLPPPMKAPQLAAAAMLPVPVSAPRRGGTSQSISKRDMPLDVRLPPESSGAGARPEGSRVMSRPEASVVSVSRSEGSRVMSRPEVSQTTPEGSRVANRPEPSQTAPEGSRVGPRGGGQPSQTKPEGSSVGPPPRRRDPIAERNARRAGAASGRPGPPAPVQQRIMRDGKPLARDESAPPKGPPRRAKTSPAVQELPKRRGPASPVKRPKDEPDEP